MLHSDWTVARTNLVYAKVELRPTSLHVYQANIHLADCLSGRATPNFAGSAIVMSFE